MKTPEQLAEERYPSDSEIEKMAQAEVDAHFSDMPEQAKGYEVRIRSIWAKMGRDLCQERFAGFQANEGPSVEDIMEIVEQEGSLADDRLEDGEDHGAAIIKMQNAVRDRLSALFTQTQVEPNELLEAGNALFAAMRRYEMDVDEEPPYKHREMMARWEKAAQGIAAAPRSAKRKEYSGEPGPTKEDAPKSPLVEQSEDAALPDGRQAHKNWFGDPFLIGRHWWVNATEEPCNHIRKLTEEEVAALPKEWICDIPNCGRKALKHSIFCGAHERARRENSTPPTN